MIDMASVYAERYKQNPQALQAAVMGQSPDPKLDPYTALNALKLVKESQRMTMAGQAQQPTSSPSIVAENMAPPPMMQGLGAMVPGAMGQAPQGTPQGMPQRAPMPQPTMRSASGGLAGMYTPEEDYAAGGIVAFKDEGFVRDPDAPEFVSDSNSGSSMYRLQSDDVDTDSELFANQVEDELTGEGGTDDQRAQVFNNYQASRKMIMDIPTDDMSAADLAKERQDALDFAKRNAGPDIYAPANKRLAEREAARAKNVSQGQGLALLAAAGAILEGNTLARGASKAFPAFAQQMGEVQKADIAEQRSIEGMQFSLADAQRKERMGDIRGAQASAESARKLKADANRSKLNKAQALAKLDSDVYRYINRPVKGAGAGPKLAEQLAAAEIAYARDPTKENKATVDALTRAASKTRTSYSTGESGPGRLGAQQEALTSKENIEANKELARYKLMNSRDWKKAVADAGGVEAAEAKFKKNWLTANPQTAAPVPKPSAAPKPAAAATTGKTITMADVDATVKSSGRTRQEVMDALKVKGYTVQ